MSVLATAVRVVRAEGITAALDRSRDRLDEWRHARRAARVAPGQLGPSSILNVLGMPSAARLGGVPLQLRHRHAWELSQRPVALLSPSGDGWRLDREHVGDNRVLEWSAPRFGAAALEDAAFEEALGRARAETGAIAVHFEGLAGIPPRSALRASSGARLIVTVHDFAAYCPRPHLWEAPASRFCGFSRDEARCHACLAAGFEVPRGFEREWRGAMADLLEAAGAIVFASAYLRDAWRALLPRLDARLQHVVEPGAISADSIAPRPPRAVRQVALVGAVTAAKGAALLPDIVQATDLRFTVLGGGDAAILRSLRGLPRTRVRGYYRAGALPELLTARDIDVALLLSLVPESYGMTLDECWQAGVPVVAFDHGAIAERVRRLGGGVLVPLERGAAGAAEVLRALRDGTLPSPEVPPRRALTTPAQAARMHVLLYRRLDLLGEPGAEDC